MMNEKHTKERAVGCAVVTLALLLFVPSIAFGQSGLTGVVRDTTGAVLPGVTVEAASPALIEKVRSVVTDGGGVYKIVDLEPGTYSVTFTLTGFSTLKREGIELSTLFTATVNAEMRVGSLDETITVSGAAPLVDVQNVTQQKVLSKEVLESLPASRVPYAYVPYLPGVVGVNLQGVVVGRDMLNLSVHGSTVSDGMMMVDGVMPGSAGAGNTLFQNPAYIQEFAVQTAANMAEYQTSGILMNIIPKDGSNTFVGYLYGAYADHHLQSDNLTDQLQAQGVHSVSALTRLWDISPAGGGRIVPNKLWFYTSARDSSVNQTVANMFYNKTPATFTYTPDFSRPAPNRVTDGDASLRLTWQATARHKISAFLDYQPHIVWNRNFGSNVSPEATNVVKYLPNNILQVGWKSPLTSRLLLEASVTTNNVKNEAHHQTDPPVDNVTIPAIELSTYLIFRAAPISNSVLGGAALSSDSYGYTHPINHTYKAAAAYVTGSHAFKVGATNRTSTRENLRVPNGALEIQLLNGVPRTLLQSATPFQEGDWIPWDLGVYAQDQWILKRLTLNYGLRYDYISEGAIASTIGPGPFVASRAFEPVENAVTWHDLSPRLGASFDLFGNGKTAVKVALGRYLGFILSASGAAINPVTNIVKTATRSWIDTNGNFVPDCDLTNFSANGECGNISNQNFGKTNPAVATNDPNYPHGFGKRSYNWESSVALNHQLAKDVSVTIAYFRRQYGNFTTTSNSLVNPADYDPYCITAPVDPRLPGGGGNQICGLYDIKPTRFGQSQTVFGLINPNNGARSQVYNGLDLTSTARFPNGAEVSGGVNVGSTATQTCNVVNSPQVLLNCDIKTPFQPNVKAFAIYPLPWWGVSTSAIFQRLAGPEITASYTATSAQIAPSLGRNLSSGAGGTATVPLIKPGTTYAEGTQQVDLRLAKTLKIGSHTRILGTVDVVNIFNWSGVSSINVTYGPAWQSPSLVQGGRSIKFTTQLDF